MAESGGSEDEAIPLQNNYNHRTSSDKSEGVQISSRRSGRFIRDIWLVFVAVVVLMLIILVVVLAIFLAYARHGKSLGRGNTESASTPRTVLVTTQPLPTTPGSEAWWNVRLPRDVIPDHYNVHLVVNLKNLTFGGAVKIYTSVSRPTNVILLHCSNLNITWKAVTSADKKEGIGIRRFFVFKKNQFCVFEMANTIKPGRYVISMAFDAYLSKTLAGLFTFEYENAAGKLRPYVASRSVPTEGRSIFPCFDEPGFKAIFNISITHASDFRALSNMPVYKSETASGLTTDHFMATMRMSTYLLAFVVCDFTKTAFTVKNGSLLMDFYVPDKQLHETGYAQQLAPQFLSYFERFYGIPYPLPKADMIALPQFSFGAMENWGLIMFKEESLLWTKETSSTDDKVYVVTIIAHEIAHQWFGNLVTMEWWEDLWLKEGFATYLQYRAADSVEPTWNVLHDYLVSHMAPGMSLDGLASSHPIKVAVKHPDEIGSIYDFISYSKGSCILRMLESFLGTKMFVGGLRRYLKRHAYNNAITDDLWKAFEDESCSRGSCVGVKDVMDTWTLQMGFPVVTLKRKNATHYIATQKHFLYDEKADVSKSKYTSPFNYTWRIPFDYITSADPMTPSRQLITTKEALIPSNGQGWIKGNYKVKGFFLVNYEESNWAALGAQLQANHKVFSAVDRAGLMLDAFNLARGGQIRYSTALSLTSYIRHEDETIPWRAMMYDIEYMQGLLSPTKPARKLLTKYLGQQANGKYKELGFTDTGSHSEKLLRSEVILGIACSTGEQSCNDNATVKFSNWMKSPSQYPIPPNFQKLIYYQGIANGGVEEWNFAFRQFQKTTGGNARLALIHGMAASREPWVLQRFLEYSLDSSKISLQHSVDVVGKVAENSPIGRRLAWTFLRSRWNSIMARFGNSIFTLGKLIRSVTHGFANEYELKELSEFTDKHPESGTANAALKQAIETVKGNIEWLQRNERDVENWLKSHT